MLQSTKVNEVLIGNGAVVRVDQIQEGRIRLIINSNETVHIRRLPPAPVENTRDRIVVAEQRN